MQRAPRRRAFFIGSVLSEIAGRQAKALRGVQRQDRAVKPVVTLKGVDSTARRCIGPAGDGACVVIAHLQGALQACHERAVHGFGAGHTKGGFLYHAICGLGPVHRVARPTGPVWTGGQRQARGLDPRAGGVRVRRARHLCMGHGRQGNHGANMQGKESVMSGSMCHEG